MDIHVLYTSIVFSLSIGFFITSIVTTFFVEDKKSKYYIPGFVFLSIVATLVIESIAFGVPRFSFAFRQLIEIPIGSAIAFGIFFFVVHKYTQAKSPA
jgi:uncharacterized membrane protein YccC